MNFDLAFDRLLGHEGGYVNNPKDPGGETNWGISKRSYPHLDIKNLTREGAKEIYLRDFWNGGRMSMFDGALSYQVFDAAVNHGISRAIKLLQKAAGVPEDGNVGPRTIGAVTGKRVSYMLALFIAARLEFWTNCPDSSWDEFGKGWARRAVSAIRYAVIDYNSENLHE